MPGKIYTKEFKEEIIGKIKSEGISGVEAANRYGINVKNVYRWLSEGVCGSSSEALEINRLKRENKQLKELIGTFVIEKERGKKD
ncbi:MAG: transposase [bacterium]|nr:transposase [bacterium]